MKHLNDSILEQFIDEATQVSDYHFVQDTKKYERGYVFCPKGETLSNGYEMDEYGKKLNFKPYDWSRIKLGEMGYSPEDVKLILENLTLYRNGASYSILSTRPLKTPEKYTMVTTPDKDVYIVFEKGIKNIYDHFHFLHCEYNKYGKFAKNNCFKK